MTLHLLVKLIHFQLFGKNMIRKLQLCQKMDLKKVQAKMADYISLILQLEMMLNIRLVYKAILYFRLLMFSVHQQTIMCLITKLYSIDQLTLIYLVKSSIQLLFLIPILRQVELQQIYYKLFLKMSEEFKLPPIHEQINLLNQSLLESAKQRKLEIYKQYKETKNRRQKELFEQNRYKMLNRKPFLSQQKEQGQILEKEKDIYLCKEPLIDDFVKAHIIEPARNTEKGIKEIKTGKTEKADGTCFGDVQWQKLSNREKRFREYWRDYNKRQKEISYKELLASQTGIQKRVIQEKRLKDIKVFIPNNFQSSFFEDHPSQILSLTQMHQHDKSQYWSPNNFYYETFDKSLEKINNQ